LQPRQSVMSMSPRVGVACLRAGERAAVADWLRAAGFEPVVLVDACFVTTEFSGRPPVLVVADAGLLTSPFIAALRKGDPNRPILAIGDAGDPNEASLARKNVAFHIRPLDEQCLILAVSLAQAENRFVRRSERRSVPRVPMSIEGTSAVLLDVSNEGLRLEVDASGGAKLLPQFVVHVPLLKMAVPVQRVWVKSATVATTRKVQCGGTLLSTDERTLKVWERLASPGARIVTERPGSPNRAEGMLGRVSNLLAKTPVVGSLALPWRGRS
jgi:hypothetical protein